MIHLMLKKLKNEQTLNAVIIHLSSGWKLTIFCVEQAVQVELAEEVF